jgi:hypothetical protein
LALVSMAAMVLTGCASTPPPTAAIAMSRIAATWAEQRRLCVAAPQGSHCDVYLRNEAPPAPYTTDGVLIQQRRLCVEHPSVANCALAQRMGREAAEEAARILPVTSSAVSSRPADTEEGEDDEEEYVPASPAPANASSFVAAKPLPSPTVRRSQRRAVDPVVAAQCSPATLAALDLAEPSTRAAILRRCASGQR